MACRPSGSAYANGERCRHGSWARVLAIFVLATGPLYAAGPDPNEGSGDRSARENARRAIPWRQLAIEDRKQVDQIVGRATLYRQLPTRVIDCDGDLFSYVAEHPELIVESWNVMGVSQLQLTPVAPGRYKVADTAGALGEVRVLHRTGGENGQPLSMLVLANGTYQVPPMRKPIRGQSVLLLRAETIDESNGRSYVTTQLDSFIRFEGRTMALVAKTLKPLIVRTADHNFVETMRFVSLFSRTAETNPDGMQRLASHLEAVPEPTRREFSSLCHQTSQRYAARKPQRQRLAARQTGLGFQ